MISHHFIGTGVWSEALCLAQDNAAQVLAEVTAQVQACHLHVVATQAVPFTPGGLTLVWVLAESHVVLHIWPELRSATLDLHICNYGTSNAANARALRDRLAATYFATGGDWSTLVAGADTADVAEAGRESVVGSDGDLLPAEG